MKVKTILVDDEPWTMEQFLIEFKDRDIELMGTFTKAKEALAYAAEHPIDLALLDVKMPDMNGLTLGKKLKEIKKDMLIIYVSAYEEYIKDAILDVRADYYLLKPYDREDIRDAIERVRHLSRRLSRNVTIRTFGEFDVFVDGRLVVFPNQKAKELLAFCIDRCGEVPMKSIVEALWEERSYDEKVKSLYRKAVASLNATLKEYGVGYIFNHYRGVCHVNGRDFTCDYYEVLHGKCIKDTMFDGKYMSDYSWGEETCGRLCRMAAKYLS